MSNDIRIEMLNTTNALTYKQQLIELLLNVVDTGSSIGFLRPLSVELADQYWDGIINSLSSSNRILLVAMQAGKVVGSVQTERCPKQNGRHRAEIQKLMVLTTHRCQGIARQLMTAIEIAARAAGCTLLFLDTVTGKPAEQVYVQLEWTRSGSIPNYAVSPDGEMESTTIFYKLLSHSSLRAA